jgi:uncharacterized membrane protein YeaQ/YmgE (transglycosylase-associated protein family)
MLLSLVGAIFVALKGWVMRVVLGCVGAVLPGVEMGGSPTFAALCIEIRYEDKL